MQILIIPAHQDSPTSWQPVTSILERVGYRVTLLSYPHPKDDDLEQQTNLAEQFLTEKTVVVGSDVGGRIAIQLMARRSQYIAGAVLLSTPSLFHKNAWTFLLKLFMFFSAPFRLFISHKRQKRIGEWFIRLTHRTPESFLYRKMINSEQDTLLPIIKVPVKLVWGAKSRRVHLNVAHHMAELLPRAEVLVVEDTSEPLQETAPVIIASYVDELARA
jgi:pimeloyl-ACP methyl ester carboxylesterase